MMLRQGTFVLNLHVSEALSEAFSDEPQSLRPEKQKSIFPHGTKLGVRHADLDAFIKKLTVATKPSSKRQTEDARRNSKRQTSTLRLVAALAKRAKIDFTGTEFSKATELAGMKISRQVAQELVDEIYDDADVKSWPDADQLPPQKEKK